jgi:hypothetical protein
MKTLQILPPLKRLIYFRLNVLYLILFIIISEPVSLSARGFEFKPGKEMSIIPFKYIEGLIIISLKIENKDVNLILDTGVPNIVLFDRIGSYGLKPDTQKRISFSGIGSDNIILGKRVSEVSAEGNIIGSGLALLIIPPNDLSKSFKMKINGLIGYDLFSRFLVTIDYTNNQLILTNPKSFTPLGFYQQKDLFLIHTKPYLKFNLTIPGVEEKEYSLLVDTGAGYDLLLNYNPYPEDKKKRNNYLGSGLTGHILGKLYTIKGIYFDNFFFNNFLVSIPYTSFYKNKDLMKNRDGTLGGKFLHKFEKVVIDYSNKKIYFQRGPLMAKTN